MSEPLRILVIDDCQSMQSLMERIIKPLLDEFPDSTVIFKTRWDEALLEIARCPTTDVALLDLKLSDIDLRQNIEKIKHMDDLVPVIVVTGEATLEHLQMIRHFGIEIVQKDAGKSFIHDIQQAVLRAALRGNERRREVVASKVRRLREVTELLSHAPQE